MSFRKILAYLFGHALNLQAAADTIFKKYGHDIINTTPQKRGEMIRDAVKGYLEATRPEYAKYEGVVVDFVYQRLRKALEH